MSLVLRKRLLMVPVEADLCLLTGGVCTFGNFEQEIMGVRRGLHRTEVYGQFLYGIFICAGHYVWRGQKDLRVCIGSESGILRPCMIGNVEDEVKHLDRC